MHEAPIATTSTPAVLADEKAAAQQQPMVDQVAALELLFQCADAEADMILMNKYTSFYDAQPLPSSEQLLISSQPLQAKLRSTRRCIQHQLAETRKLNQELFKALGSCPTFTNPTSATDAKAGFQELVASPISLHSSPHSLNSRQPQGEPYALQEYQAELPAIIDCSYPSVYTNPSFTTKDVVFSRDSQSEFSPKSATGSLKQQCKAYHRFDFTFSDRHDTECLRLDQSIQGSHGQVAQ